jgi:hypothetical protein
MSRISQDFKIPTPGLLEFGLFATDQSHEAGFVALYPRLGKVDLNHILVHRFV